MNMQNLIEAQQAAQAPMQRNDGLPHPTPIEIRMAIWDGLMDDARDPQTPHVPVHVMGVIRRAIEAANRGEYE